MQQLSIFHKHEWQPGDCINISGRMAFIMDKKYIEGYPFQDKAGIYPVRFHKPDRYDPAVNYIHAKDVKPWEPGRL